MLIMMMLKSFFSGFIGIFRCIHMGRRAVHAQGVVSEIEIEDYYYEKNTTILKLQYRINGETNFCLYNASDFETKSKIAKIEKGDRVNVIVNTKIKKAYPEDYLKRSLNACFSSIIAIICILVILYLINMLTGNL